MDGRELNLIRVHTSSYEYILVPTNLYDGHQDELVMAIGVYDLAMSTYRRSLQRLGDSSLAVTLPKEWCDEYELEKGTEVVLRETDDGCLEFIPPGRE